MSAPRPAIPAMAARPAGRQLLMLAALGRPWLAAGAVGSILVGVAAVLQAGSLAHALHGVAIDGRAPAPATLGLLFGAFLLRGLAGWGVEVAGARASATVRTRLRRQAMHVVTALGPLPVAARTVGGLAMALGDHIDALDGFIARFLPGALHAVAVIGVILLGVGARDPVAGAILGACLPLLVLFLALSGMGAEAAARANAETLSRMGGHFLDRVQGLATLKLFGRAAAETARVIDAADAYRRGAMAVLRIAFLSSAVLEFFAALSVALLAVYAGFSLIGELDLGVGPWSGPVTLESGLFALLLAPELFLPLRQMAARHHDRAAALGALAEITARLPDLAGPDLHRPDRAGPGAPPRPRPAPPVIGPALPVSLEHVSARYASGAGLALAGVDLRVAAGEMVALGGPSGSGKSTVLNLLAGFLPPVAGRVLIGGVDVAALDPVDLALRVTWIGQTPHVIPGTVRENIRLARPDADDAAIRHAAAQAAVLDFTDRLPLGLDTPVGGRGFGLSGGQAQRVALARAFLRASPVLLLDEPTAHLDSDTAAQLCDALDRLRRGRTVIIATHNPQLAARADRRVTLPPARPGLTIPDAPAGRA